MGIKTVQFDLSNWKGMDRWTHETECDPHYWYDIQNMDVDDGGVTSKRVGVGQVATLSGTVNLIYNHQDQIQGLNKAVFIDGSSLSVVSNLGADGESWDATFSTSNCRHYAVTDDVGVTFISNENGGAIKMLAYVNGAWVFQDADLVAPTVPTSAAGGVTTDLSGSFSAVCTYVDEWGSESPMSPIGNTVSISATSIDTGVVVSSDPTVDYLNFYLLGPGMSVHQFAGTASNTTGTFSFTGNMAQLMAGDELDYERVPMPVGKYVSIYEDMLLIGADPNVPDTVWCSNRQYHRQWNDNFARVVTGDGQPVRGFVDSYDRKLILKADSVHLCDGDHHTTFRTKMYNRVHGATVQSAAATADDAGCWWSDDGFYGDNGAAPEDVTQILRDYIFQLDSRNMTSVYKMPVAARHNYFRRIYLALREFETAERTDGGSNNIALVWNYQQNSWVKYSGLNIFSMGVIQNADDYEILYGGDTEGNIYQFGAPTHFFSTNDVLGSTGSTTISCYAETPWMHMGKLLGSPEWERTRTIPRYLQVYASAQGVDATTPVNLDCGYYVDFDRDNCVNTFTVSFRGHDWPTIRPYKDTIYYGGRVGTYNWVKWRFEHAVLDEHIRIHRLVFGFKLKPSMD